jgi:hypothetical protein
MTWSLNALVWDGKIASQKLFDNQWLIFQHCMKNKEHHISQDWQQLDFQCSGKILLATCGMLEIQLTVDFTDCALQVLGVCKCCLILFPSRCKSKQHLNVQLLSWSSTAWNTLFAQIEGLMEAIDALDSLQSVLVGSYNSHYKMYNCSEIITTSMASICACKHWRTRSSSFKKLYETWNLRCWKYQG